MASEILFAPVAYSRYERSETLPEKFVRLLSATGLADKVKGKSIAIKMHIGGDINYSTIPTIFVRKLVDFIHENEGECFITDHAFKYRNPAQGVYSEHIVGCPVLEDCGFMGKYFYNKQVNFRSLHDVDVGGHIHDADIMIDFSHFKGHGACGFGGAAKNIAMGCVTDRTRQQIHSLEGGILWDEKKCVHCGQCVGACNHYANRFEENGNYHVNYHHCTLCQHCKKVCPTGAITLDSHNYADFQRGLAITTKTVLDTFAPGCVYYINVLLQITALCDCWGMTTPALVPDIGIMAGDDIVAVDSASLDAVKAENLIPGGVPAGMELRPEGHLFYRLHGKDPYGQIAAMEGEGLGSREYKITNIE